MSTHFEGPTDRGGSRLGPAVALVEAICQGLLPFSELHLGGDVRGSLSEDRPFGTTVAHCGRWAVERAIIAELVDFETHAVGARRIVGRAKLDPKGETSRAPIGVEDLGLTVDPIVGGLAAIYPRGRQCVAEATDRLFLQDVRASASRYGMICGRFGPAATARPHIDKVGVEGSIPSSTPVAPADYSRMAAKSLFEFCFQPDEFSGCQPR